MPQTLIHEVAVEVPQTVTHEYVTQVPASVAAEQRIVQTGTEFERPVHREDALRSGAIGVGEAQYAGVYNAPPWAGASTWPVGCVCVRLRASGGSRPPQWPIVEMRRRTSQARHPQGRGFTSHLRRRGVGACHKSLRKPAVGPKHRCGAAPPGLLCWGPAKWPMARPKMQGCSGPGQPGTWPVGIGLNCI